MGQLQRVIEHLLVLAAAQNGERLNIHVPIIYK